MLYVRERDMGRGRGREMERERENRRQTKADFGPFVMQAWELVWKHLIRHGWDCCSWGRR
jgi:hypothetical protein